jgi:small-conductance mechanosensitive channel
MSALFPELQNGIFFNSRIPYNSPLCLRIINKVKVEVNDLLEWMAKFFGHIPVAGIEALMFRSLQAALVLLAVFVTLRFLFKLIDRRVKDGDREHKDDIRTYKKVARFFFWTFGILFAIHVVGFDLSSVFTAGGLLAVALGLALKNVAENYVGGLIIKTDDTVKHGDVLEIDGQLVRVKSIGFRATVVRTKDDSDVLIPNALLVQNKIGNFTRRDFLCRLSTTIGVSYSSDLKQVREVLEGVCSNFDGLSAQHDPVVLLTDFGDSSVNYQVYVWIEDPWNRRVIKSELNEAVWWALKDAGIVIAFPQLDVHLDKSSDETSPG